MKERRRSRSKLLVISQYYRPEPNFITADVAEHLGDVADVVVITAHPSYPLGRHYDSVTSLWPKRSLENGVTVWRLPSVPDQSTSLVRRAVSYGSFALGAALFAPFVAPRARVVWVYNTPFTNALAALWHRLLGRRLVYTVADLWPESFTAAGVVREGFIIRTLYRYRRWINSLADMIVCSTQGTLDTFAAEGKPSESLTVIPVWVETTPPPRGESQRPTGHNIVYAGNLGPSQRLDTVILGAVELMRRGVDLTIDIYGTGSVESRLRALAEEHAATNVRFHGRVPPSEAFARLAEAAGQIVCLAPSPEFLHTVPSKLVSSFAAGTPLLFGLAGEAAEIARASTGGIEFDPTSPSSFADAAQRLLVLPAAERARMREALRGTYEREYEPKVLLERYTRILLPQSLTP